ncbi:hypothetical protein MC885_013986 [Smutsia gigantea]|nr:hypothetical protein MC885_013986 [Smutsia gigantea]
MGGDTSPGRGPVGGFLALTSVCPWSPAPPHPCSWVVVREELGLRPSPRVSADPAPGRGSCRRLLGLRSHVIGRQRSGGASPGTDPGPGRSCPSLPFQARGLRPVALCTEPDPDLHFRLESGARVPWLPAARQRRGCSLAAPMAPSWPRRGHYLQSPLTISGRGSSSHSH